MGEAAGFLPFPKGFATKAIHEAQDPDDWQSAAVVLPLVLSTTYKQAGPGEVRDFEYSRSGNPTRNVLEKVLARLDNTQYGLVFSSGLGAQTTVTGMFGAGDHLVCMDDVYGGTGRIFRQITSKFGIETTFVDFTNIENLEKAIKPNTRMIWAETPTNPLMKLVDIKAVAQVAKKHNILFLVDNTFLTSYLQRPIDLGADMVLYSLTKYVNGHSDVVMGCVVTNNKKVYDKLKFLQNAMGAVPSPFDCYQVNRGLKTLALRMQQHLKNGAAVATFLESHPKVERVLHPGIPSHPQYELSKRQTCGHCGTFSFYLKGDLKTSDTFLRALKVFSVAESLGGFESLAEIPSIMTHASVPLEHRAKIGITDNLVRISVGIEDVEDLISDLEQALNKI